MIRTDGIINVKYLKDLNRKAFTSSQFSISKFFDSGLENDNFTEICGEAGSGKTNLCLFLSFLFAINEKVNVLYITINKKFNETRFNQFLNSNLKNDFEKENIRNKIFTEHFNSTLDFDDFLSNIESFIIKHKIYCIIIDPFTALVDIAFVKEDLNVDYVKRSIYLKEYLNEYLIQKIAVF